MNVRITDKPVNSLINHKHKQTLAKAKTIIHAHRHTYDSSDSYRQNQTKTLKNKQFSLLKTSKFHINVQCLRKAPVDMNTQSSEV